MLSHIIFWLPFHVSLSCSRKFGPELRLKNGRSRGVSPPSTNSGGHLGSLKWLSQCWHMLCEWKTSRMPTQNVQMCPGEALEGTRGHGYVILSLRAVWHCYHHIVHRTWFMSDSDWIHGYSKLVIWDDGHTERQTHLIPHRDPMISIDNIAFKI